METMTGRIYDVHHSTSIPTAGFCLRRVVGHGFYSLHIGGGCGSACYTSMLKLNSHLIKFLKANWWRYCNESMTNYKPLWQLMRSQTRAIVRPQINQVWFDWREMQHMRQPHTLCFRQTHTSSQQLPNFEPRTNSTDTDYKIDPHRPATTSALLKLKFYSR